MVERRTMLAATSAPLAALHDVALLDLDGVVYVGGAAVPHATAALAGARAAGMRLAFVTNNAARTPGDVAAHLRALGIPARADEVVTSSQAAAHVLAERLPVGARVLVVGAEGLVAAVRERGLVPVFSATEEPAAVVQGFGPRVGWPELAEAAYAVTRGLPWVATNGDATLPTARGRAPGNGALVAAVRLATGREPMVTGKPEVPMNREAVERSAATAPVVVGDRLDTDIEGARRAGLPSLLVLTGVSDPIDVVLAPRGRRPDYVAADLRGLLVAHPAVTVGPDGVATCRGWRGQVSRGGLELARVTELDLLPVERPAERPVERPAELADEPAHEPAEEHRSRTAGDPLDALRAACGAVWSSAVQALPRAAVSEALSAAGIRPAR